MGSHNECIKKCKCIRFSAVSSNLPYSGLSPYKIGENFIEFTESHSDLGVVIDRNMKFATHIRNRSCMLQAVTSNILSCTLCREANFIINIFKFHIRPQLEYGSNLWNLGYVGQTKLMERVQRRWTREVAGLENLTYGDRLKRLDLFSFQGRLLRSDLISVWKIFHLKSAIKPESLFELYTNNITRGHPFKIKVQRTSLEVRRRFFSIRIINRWNALDCATVCADSVDIFKRRLACDLGEELFYYHD